MAKKEIAKIKLQIPAGAANPSPPVGPALGQHGLNIMEFCKAFNAKTQDEKGMIIPVVITAYSDRSFSFITKMPPMAVLIIKELGLAAVLRLQISQGQGEGTALAFTLFDAGVKAYKEMETFAQAGVHTEVEEFSILKK